MTRYYIRLIFKTALLVLVIWGMIAGCTWMGNMSTNPYSNITQQNNGDDELYHNNGSTYYNNNAYKRHNYSY